MIDEALCIWQIYSKILFFSPPDWNYNINKPAIRWKQTHLRPFWYLGVNKVWLYNSPKLANFYLIKMKWADAESEKKTCFIAYLLYSNLDKTYQVRYKFSFVFQLWLKSQIRNKEFIPCDAEIRKKWNSWKLKPTVLLFLFTEHRVTDDTDCGGPIHQIKWPLIKTA